MWARVRKYPTCILRPRAGAGQKLNYFEFLPLSFLIFAHWQGLANALVTPFERHFCGARDKICQTDFAAQIESHLRINQQSRWQRLQPGNSVFVLGTTGKHKRVRLGKKKTDQQTRTFIAGRLSPKERHCLGESMAPTLKTIYVKRMRSKLTVNTATQRNRPVTWT